MKTAEDWRKELDFLQNVKWTDQTVESGIRQIQADALRWAAERAMNSKSHIPLGFVTDLLEQASQLDPKSENSDCRGKLPEPTKEQAACLHTVWKTMHPQPRHCIQCGLLMWDAGD